MNITNNIPKIVHYIWIGSDMPDNVSHNIDQWKLMLPDYSFKIWDISAYETMPKPQYVLQAYAAKKYSFVADYIRLYALYHYGGIYLDTDVEIYKNFDNLLDYDLVISYESYARLCTAVILAKCHNKYIKDLLEYYNYANFIEKNGNYNLTVNTILFFEYFFKKKNITIKETTQIKDHCLFLKSKYFSTINVFTRKIKIKKESYTAHLIYGSWGDNKPHIKNRFRYLMNCPILWRFFAFLGYLKKCYFYKIKKNMKTSLCEYIEL